MKFSSLYVHVPFCLRKCDYCDFISFPVGQYPQLFADYGRLLLAELELWREQAELSALQTLYIGGGTPSLLPPAQLAALIAALPPLDEISIEANPESVDAAKLRALRAAGCNRISFGVQSFDDGLLAAMGRGHSAAAAVAAVGLARQAGFANIGLDLIYGLPEQSLSQWRETLLNAMELRPQHISLYGLTLPADSPWGRRAAAGDLAVPDDDAQAEMLELAMRLLPDGGYRHYEIANFALDGYQSRHNQAYWRRENYLGLGCAAASCHLAERWSNFRDLPAYAAAVQGGELPLYEREQLHIDEVIAEAVFLGLRLREGINFDGFERRYGCRVERRYKKQLRRLHDLGLLELDEGGMRLSDHGVMLGNEAFREFV
ncbi:MAG: radical SAM family heme chaperone HemW [Bacillota bacterium]|nr:radical SAM family heme chaperone HemW [Bacillota bacterium]